MNIAALVLFRGRAATLLSAKSISARRASVLISGFGPLHYFHSSIMHQLISRVLQQESPSPHTLYYSVELTFLGREHLQYKVESLEVWRFSNDPAPCRSVLGLLPCASISCKCDHVEDKRPCCLWSSDCQTMSISRCVICAITVEPDSVHNCSHTCEVSGAWLETLSWHER